MKTGKNTFSAGVLASYRKQKQHFSAEKTKKSPFKTAYSKNFKRIQSFFAHKIAMNPAFRPCLVGVFSLIVGIFIGNYVIPVNSAQADSQIEVSADATSDNREQLPEKTTAEKAEIADIASTSTVSSYSSTNSGYTASASNTSASYTSGADLVIPSLGITTSVSASNLSGNELSVPSSTASYYGTLIMGHSSGVFANLPRASVGQGITYNGRTYVIDSVRTNLTVSSDRQKVGNFSMYVLTNLGSNRIVLMTCAGSYQAGFGYTHRTLVFATLK